MSNLKNLGPQFNDIYNTIQNLQNINETILNTLSSRFKIKIIVLDNAELVHTDNKDLEKILNKIVCKLSSTHLYSDISSPLRGGGFKTQYYHCADDPYTSFLLWQYDKDREEHFKNLINMYVKYEQAVVVICNNTDEPPFKNIIEDLKKNNKKIHIVAPMIDTDGRITLSDIYWWDILEFYFDSF